MSSTLYPIKPWNDVSSGKFPFKITTPMTVIVLLFLAFGLVIWRNLVWLSIVPPRSADIHQIVVDLPKEFQLFQRDETDRADIPIKFRLPSIGDSRQYEVLARWNGSRWQEVQTFQMASGEIVAVLPDQPVGQGDFELKIPALDLVKTIKIVSVGDLFVIAGQSNAVGYFRQPHLYPREEIKCCAYDFKTKSWKIASDPINYFHREEGRGSVWPLVAIKLVKQNGNVPVGFIDFSISMTRLVRADEPNESHLPSLDWQPQNGCYQNLIKGVWEATNTTCQFQAILWFQGESDACLGITEEEYKSELKKLVDSLCSDFVVDDPRIIVAKIGDIYPSDLSLRDSVADIQRAQEEIIDEITFFTGPDGRLLSLDDSSDEVHFTSEESAHQLARMWVDSILAMEEKLKENKKRNIVKTTSPALVLDFTPGRSQERPGFLLKF